MAIGRISGPMLKSNLLRDGIDLAFETDLLYLDVNNQRVGVKTSQPSHDFTVNGTTRVTNATVTNQLTVADIQINSNSIMSTNGDLILSAGENSTIVCQKPLNVDNITVSTNIISSDTNLVLQPAAGYITSINSTKSLKIPVGTVLERPTAAAGMIRFNSTVGKFEGFNGSYWINLHGIGDVDGNTQITAELTPGANDNVFRFYSNGVLVATLTSETFTTNKVVVDNITIDQNIISTTGTSTDLNIPSPVFIGDLLFNGNTITNTASGGITTIAQSGSGYLKISGTNGFVVPLGTTSERPTGSSVEVGMTRYNTETLTIETWSGSEWIVPGVDENGISRDDAEDLAVGLVLSLG